MGGKERKFKPELQLDTVVESLRVENLLPKFVVKDT